MSADTSTTEHVSLEERVRVFVLEAIEDENYFLVKLIARGYKGSRAIEVFIDADSGALVNELASIGRRLRFLLDSEMVIDGKYTMTVSSPGDQYAFILPRQYNKHVGKTLDIQYETPDSLKETDTVRGSLQNVSGSTLSLRSETTGKKGTGKKEAGKIEADSTEILIDRITKASVVLPW
jgi:ribosome maturation factor RimP